MSNEGGSSDWWLFRRCFAEAKPYWPHVVGYLVLSLLATPLALLNPLPLKIAVDNVLGALPLPRYLAPLVSPGGGAGAVLVLAALLMVAIAVLGQLQRLAVSALYTRTAEKLVLRFRARLFDHVQRLSMLFHDRTESSESAYRVLWDGAAIRHVALDSLTPLVSSGSTLVAMFYVVFRIDRSLAVVSLVVAPALFVLGRAYRRRLRGRWREVKALEARGLAVVHEVLSSIRVVQAFGQEAREHRRFVEQSAAGAAARVRATLTAEAFGALVALTVTAGTATVLWVGVGHVQGGALTLGELLVVMAYLGQLYGPLQSMSKSVGGMQSHFASAERALALLDRAPEVVEPPHARRIGRAAGAISLREVSFAYAERSEVLSGISLDLPPGVRVGLVGATGAGKTTLTGLLLRLYDPTRGSILLDGVDLRAFRIADLRRQFALLPQEPLLFAASIAENIAYARPGADRREIVAAAREAGADEFIRRFPDGYETMLGEGGRTLSGGERQRVAMARAFLKDAPVLILDEPTSAVDLATEAMVLAGLERLAEGRTTIVISHRPSTLVRCDLVVRLERGRLVEAHPVEAAGPSARVIDSPRLDAAELATGEGRT